MEVRKKSPQDLHTQLERIMDYYLCKYDVADNEVRERVYNKVKKIQEICYKYEDNIYKFAGVDKNKNVQVSNYVFLHVKATKSQYANNN